MSSGPSSNRLLVQYWQDIAPSDRLAHLVRDTARAYTRALQSRLAQHNIPFSHWQFLRILWRFDGLTQRELSERAGVMEPTTQVVISAMEQRGYVGRRQQAGNRKNKHVYLTVKGRALESVLVPLAQETNVLSQQGISEQDVQVTRQVLLRLLGNLAQEDSLPPGSA